MDQEIKVIIPKHIEGTDEQPFTENERKSLYGCFILYMKMFGYADQKLDCEKSKRFQDRLVKLLESVPPYLLRKFASQVAIDFTTPWEARIEDIAETNQERIVFWLPEEPADKMDRYIQLLHSTENEESNKLSDGEDEMVH